MEDVVANFGRLEWWANTVIIALIVSLFAGFARDWMLHWLSGLSGWFRQRALNNRKEIVLAARLIGTDVQLHISYIFSLAVRLLGVTLFIFWAIIIGPIHQFYESFPEYDPIRILTPLPMMGSTTTGIISLAILAVGVPLFFGLGRRFDVLRLVRRKATRRAIRSRRT